MRAARVQKSSVCPTLAGLELALLMVVAQELHLPPTPAAGSPEALGTSTGAWWGEEEDANSPVSGWSIRQEVTGLSCVDRVTP